MAITFPQYKADTHGGGGGSSVSATFTNPIAADSIIVALVTTDTGITSYTFIDDKGDAVTDSGLGIITDGTIGTKTAIRAFLSATTGAQTVTVTPDTSFSFAELNIWEISGITGAVFDKAIQAPGSGSTSDSGSTGTLSAASEAAIGYGISNASYTSEGTGWALDAITPFNDLAEHQSLSSNAAINATGNLSGSTSWRMWCVTLMSGVGPPPPPVTPGTQGFIVFP